MHELAVTESILEIALRYADGASRITHLYLVIGELSGIVGESVQFYWDMLTEGTIAAGSKLVFHHVKIRMNCSSCDHEFEPDSRTFECPQCGGNSVSIVAGREFRLDSIEVE